MVKIESKPKEKGKSSSEVEKTFHLVGEVLCPYCAPKMFTVHHEPSQKKFFLWKVSNYVRHLKKLHPRTAGKVADNLQTVKNEITANTNLIQNNKSPGCAKNTESVIAYFLNKNNNIPTAEDEAIYDIQTENKENATTSNSNQYNSIASGSTKIELPNQNFQSLGQCNLVDYSDSGASSDEDDCLANDRYGKLDYLHLILNCLYYFP